MKKIDGRKLSTERQQQIRYTAIELCKRGKTYVETANILGISLTAVGKWYRKYKKYGTEALVIKKRGIKLGSKSKLSPNRMDVLKIVLVKYTPDDLDLGYSLWTRQAIKSLLSKVWRIKVDLTTISRYMKKLGFTPQKPIKRAYEQNPKAVKKWLNKTYPEIAKKATREGAEIYWLDETKLSSYSSYLRGFSPKGKTPIIRMKAKRMSLNIISSISKLGKMRFNIYEGSINIKILTEFTNRLLKNVPKKIFIIMDNLALHHSLKFKDWLKKHKNFIEVFYLPPYSPELNPDERLNRDLKTHFHSGSSVQNKKELKCKILSFMMKAQKNPKRLMNYFNSDYVRYAA
jgi:transposase